MGFVYAIVQTILTSLSNVFRKKALDISNISKGLFSLHGEIVGWIFLIVFIILGLVNFNIFLDWNLVLVMFLTMGLETYAFFINQDLYKENKISTLVPFENLNYLFTILLGFAIFHDTSTISFLISVFAVIVVILFNVDFKNFELPKNLKKIFIVQFILGINALLLAYLVKTSSSFDTLVLDVVCSTIILLVFTIKLSELKQIHKQSKEFYINRYVSGFLGRGGYAISLFLIGDLGIELVTLLKFLGLGATLIFSYLMLKDIPTKKDIVFAIIVSTLVVLGMYFK